jgi:vitamin D 1,25-hydroxylase
MISLGVITLLERPDQLAVLRAEPETMVTAVEELLRFLSIADIAGMRCAKADIELDGQTVAAGEGVIVSNFINNRDADAFPDPDTFDVRRPARHHLAFGYGVHQCLAVPVEELPLRLGDSIQGVDRLPITWWTTQGEVRSRARGHGPR